MSPKEHLQRAEQWLDAAEIRAGDESSPSLMVSLSIAHSLITLINLAVEAQQEEDQNAGS